MTVQLFLNNYVETTTASSQALLSIETTFSHELSKMILVGKDIEMLMSIHHTICLTSLTRVKPKEKMTFPA